MRQISADEIEKITKRAFRQAAERDREERRQAAEQLRQDSALARARDAVRRDLLANPEVEQARSRLSRHQPATAGGAELAAAAQDRAALEGAADALPRRTFVPAFAAGPDAGALARAAALPVPDATHVAELRDVMVHGATEQERDAARQELNAMGAAAVSRKIARGGRA